MPRWKRGELEIEALLASGELQKLAGAAANGERLMEKAAVTLTTARTAVATDPDSAFVLAYDAARRALTGLLAHQGLRPTTKGGHYAVEQAVRAQFGSARGFGSSVRCGDVAMSWSIPSALATTPLRTRPATLSRTPKRS